MLNSLARNHGLLPGLTSGAVAWGVHHYLPNLKENDVAVMIFGDSGRSYLSKNVFKATTVNPSATILQGNPTYKEQELK